MAQDSLLTDAYREMLDNKPEPSDYTRKTRMRMRNRTIQGLQDIAKLNERARDKDIEPLFHREKDSEQINGNQQLPDGRPELQKANWVPAMHMVALAWRGLRLNGMDKDEIFKHVIGRGIEWGEADYHGVDRGTIESEMSLTKLDVRRNRHDMDPLEKWKRGLGLSGEDMKELHDRLSDHPDVDSTLGKDLGELIDKHLIESNE